MLRHRRGLPALYLSFTSGMSSHFESVGRILEDVLASHPEADIRIVDTRLASTGEAVIVFSALDLQEKGTSIDEAEAWIAEVRSHVHVSFMVDDLEYLKRGGRVSSAAAIAGSLLDVKPIGPVIGSHVGPGMVSLCYWGAKPRA